MTIEIYSTSNEPQLQNDFYTQEVFPGRNTYRAYVLSNDKPAGDLRLVRVDKVMGPWGDITVRGDDPLGDYLLYELDARDVIGGQRITDTWSYTATKKGGSTEYHANVTISTYIKPW